jgi:hypothetical protein
MYYAYRCPYCEHERDIQFPMGTAPKEHPCDRCMPEKGKPNHMMKRNYAAESKPALYHPSRDMYSEKLRIGARKGTQAKRRGEL